MAQDIQQGYVEDEQGVRAPVQTTTQTLDVVCLDSYGNETTFKIDFPKSTIALSEVTAAFNYAINTNHWISRYDYPFVSVKSAKKVTTVKTVEALE